MQKLMQHVKERKKLNKKAAFDIINAGMISFITFVLIAILVIMLISTVQETSIVCGGISENGACFNCPSGYAYNSSAVICCNDSAIPAASINCTTATPAQTVSRVEYDGSAYNATKDLMEAGMLPPQFAQIIIIVIIIVGILGMLTMLGYGVYNRMRR